MLSGVFLHRFRTIDEFDLHGKGREVPWAVGLFVVGGLLLSAIPVVTLFFGKSLLDAAALDGGYPWLPTIFVISSMATGGAVLRVSGRLLGWGPADRGDERQAAEAREEEGEEEAPREYTPPLMLLVPAVLLLGAIVIGLIPGAVPGIEVAAGHFRDHLAYINWVLHGFVHFAPASTSHVEGFDYAYAGGATLGAIALGALGLFGGPLRRRLPDLLLQPVAVAVGRLRHVHSGHIGDYIAWWTAGAAALGGASLIFLR
jgi:multicomponent Na+:H+ antiporter subunit D